MHPTPPREPPAFTFSNYEIARSFDSSFAGVSCPNTVGNCWNWHAEPNIATAPDGAIYTTSENAAFNHPSDCQDPTGGTLAQLLYICGAPPYRESDGQGNFQGTNGKGSFSFSRDHCLDGDNDSVDSSNRGDGKDFHLTTIDSVLYDGIAHTMTVAGLGTVNGSPVAYTFVATESSRLSSVL